MSRRMIGLLAALVLCLHGTTLRVRAQSVKWAYAPPAALGTTTPLYVDPHAAVMLTAEGFLGILPAGPGGRINRTWMLSSPCGPTLPVDSPQTFVSNIAATKPGTIGYQCSDQSGNTTVVSLLNTQSGELVAGSPVPQFGRMTATSNTSGTYCTTSWCFFENGTLWNFPGGDGSTNSQALLFAYEDTFALVNYSLTTAGLATPATVSFFRGADGQSLVQGGPIALPGLPSTEVFSAQAGRFAVIPLAPTPTSNISVVLINLASISVVAPTALLDSGVFLPGPALMQPVLLSSGSVSVVFAVATNSSPGAFASNLTVTAYTVQIDGGASEAPVIPTFTVQIAAPVSSSSLPPLSPGAPAFEAFFWGFSGDTLVVNIAQSDQGVAKSGLMFVDLCTGAKLFPRDEDTLLTAESVGTLPNGDLVLADDSIVGVFSSTDGSTQWLHAGSIVGPTNAAPVDPAANCLIVATSLSTAGERYGISCLAI